MTGLPDPNASRAVLIGVHQYETLDALPAVEQNLTGLRDVFTDPALWGLPESNCVLVSQPQSSRAVLDVLWETARQATDALIVYYAGHGLTDPRSDELCLALPDSDPERSYTALPYESVRRVVLEAGAQAVRKVVILDCCYSGRALGPGMSASTQIADQAVVDGSHLLTATAATRKALAPLGERYTAFTGELISTLTEGVPNGPELLDMETVYRRLHARLAARSLPTPQQRNRNAGGLIALARNTAFGVAPEPPPTALPSARVAQSTSDDVREGFVRLATSIARTLGPRPTPFMYTEPGGAHAVTTDPAVICAVTAGSGTGTDPGGDLVRALVDQMRRDWSDGAATAVVMAQAMIRAALDFLRVDGVLPAQLGAELLRNGDWAAETIRGTATKARERDQLIRVIAAATDNRSEATMLVRAAGRVGREGVIQVKPRPSRPMMLETHEGVFFPAKIGNYPAHTFADEALLLLPGQRPRDLRRWARKVYGTAVLLQAQTDQLVLTFVGGSLAPWYIKLGDPLGVLGDIARLIGADLTDPRCFVVVPKIRVDGDGLYVERGPRYDAGEVAQQVEVLRVMLAHACSAAESDRLRLGLAQMAGDVATVWLGSSSSDRDADLATRVTTLLRARDGLSALIEHGFVDGAGVALQKVASEIAREQSSPAMTVLHAGLAAPAPRLKAVSNRRVFRRRSIKDSAAVTAGAVQAATATTERYLRLI
ncbi:hypothetical protein GCM10022254_48540 [Actinomadura meridiana]|uniref:Peptidase C14 caspase domain-containing protein n=1 Tax=Actinomadura meridiana TaxID=559626 RepID=A0ABP8CBL3_9ACTN